MEVAYEKLKLGQEITAVFPTLYGCEFCRMVIEKIEFEPKHDFLYLRIFGRDKEGDLRMVYWIFQDGRVLSTSVVKRISC